MFFHGWVLWWLSEGGHSFNAMALQAPLKPPWDTGSQAGALSPSSPTFRFERVSGDLPGQQITSGDGPIHIVKEQLSQIWRE
jgi:hypothetical protein